MHKSRRVAKGSVGYDKNRITQEYQKDNKLDFLVYKQKMNDLAEDAAKLMPKVIYVKDGVWQIPEEGRFKGWEKVRGVKEPSYYVKEGAD
jgi:hypothetical protein